MSAETANSVAIVDYGMGNLFSVEQACRHVGLNAVITSSGRDIERAVAVILPGVGAFPDAMQSLERNDLVRVLQDVAESDTPLVGICLGMQLLMRESQEFGRTHGLGIVDGEVVRLKESTLESRALKVPHIGWDRICDVPEPNGEGVSEAWQDSFLGELDNHTFMYFVHSFVVCPSNPEITLTTTQYGPIEFCSSLQMKNAFACQFHPERSGGQGIQMYRNLAALLADASLEC